MVRCWGEDSRSAGHKPCGISHLGPLRRSCRLEKISGYTMLEISATGAILVRPDGYIIWRAPTLLSEKLNQLMMQVSCD